MYTAEADAQVVNTLTGELAASLKIHQGSIRAMESVPNESAVVTASEDQKCRLIDIILTPDDDGADGGYRYNR